MAGPKEIILGVTGSVAIYKACELVRRLKEHNCNVTVVMTAEARQLIKPVLFQSLSGNKVYGDMFEQPEEWEVKHISLAEKADAVVVAPATANIIGKIASGICDDMLSCVVCATRAPVVVCPAMNEAMYRNPIVQENCKKLHRLGYFFVEPRKGKLACGKIGIGCLAEVDIIVRDVLKISAT
jgi:phosphopantothenoylcysteine decarboxylase / phosphopantothenate---cysteine ligase